MQKIISIITSLTLIATIVSSGIFADADCFIAPPLEESAHETEWLYANTINARHVQHTSTKKKSYQSVQTVSPKSIHQDTVQAITRPIFVKNRLFESICAYLI